MIKAKIISLLKIRLCCPFQVFGVPRAHKKEENHKLSNLEMFEMAVPVCMPVPVVIEVPLLYFRCVRYVTDLIKHQIGSRITSGLLFLSRLYGKCF
jgi:hypothetical protein